MLKFPHYSEHILIIAPIVFLLVWLFNSYRLGKFRRKKPSSGSPGVERNECHRSVIICGAVLALIAAALLIVLGK